MVKCSMFVSYQCKQRMTDQMSFAYMHLNDRVVIAKNRQQGHHANCIETKISLKITSETLSAS